MVETNRFLTTQVADPPHGPLRQCFWGHLAATSELVKNQRRLETPRRRAHQNGCTLLTTGRILRFFKWVSSFQSSALEVMARWDSPLDMPLAESLLGSVMVWLFRQNLNLRAVTFVYSLCWPALDS